MKGFVLVVLLLSLLSSTLSIHEHIARTSSPSEMVISWFTFKPLASPVVRYYSNPSHLLTSKGYSATYNATTGYVHHTVLTDLTPDTLYYYSTSTDTQIKWSPWFNFVTPNLTFTAPFQIPIYGDLGITNAANTMARIKKLVDDARSNLINIPFILHVGDISYADDRDSIEYEKVWNQWFVMMQSTLSKMPYMVMPGNHEHESGKPFLKYSQYFVDFNYRFKMPLAKPINPDSYYNQVHNMWWSFDHQNVHLIALSTETDFVNSPFNVTFGDQIEWLKKDLQAASRNRKNVPWIVALGHRPMYSSACCDYFQEMLPKVQNAFEDLFHQHDVDAFFCGHVHAYERIWPVYKNKTTQKNYNEPQGLVTITVGGAGNLEGLMNTWVNPLPDWSALRYDTDETYGILSVESDSVLKWNVHRASDNAIVDSIVVTKTH